ncbi:hypothetical protein T01_1851 [Trichinella spiralis]|uniref:Uncharacterized protein n=1 Tax=Trichinella spiralis TaxID=6334 RepID=A0A0V1BG26_TRISP|nr:hypothetical protein T01_1851 [Trichinella spiralis]
MEKNRLLFLFENHGVKKLSMIICYSDVCQKVEVDEGWTRGVYAFNFAALFALEFKHEYFIDDCIDLIFRLTK